MKKVIFALNRQECSDQAVVDFKEDGTHVGTGYPYAKGMPFLTTTYSGSITSIPSPYARMHITDFAFRELASGHGLYRADQRAQHQQMISADYSRALSHCLDMFEMLFRANDMELREKGITIKQIKLHSWKNRNNNPDLKSLIEDSGANPNRLGIYLQTLELYREEYLKSIDRTVSKFDFNSLYIFKYNGKTFAASSPFTGFFVNSDCDLSDANLQTPLDNGGQHNLFTQTPTDWCGLDKRSKEFKEFLYLLLNVTGLKNNYQNLFEVITKDEYITNNITRLNNTSFNSINAYKQFNINTTTPLQAVVGLNENNVFIRPEGLDVSYLKYYLYLDNPVKLEISPDAYNTPINKRQFPDGSGTLVPWLGVKDILADALFVLPYEINDNYKAISYYDKTNGQNFKRCLIPIKKTALDFFDESTLVQGLEITKHENGTFLVRLTLPLVTGGTIVLTREYSSSPSEACGVIVEASKLNPFALGIYPFVKSNKFDNIYKVIFYNVFSQDPSKANLKFYYRNATTNVVHEYNNNNVQQNCSHASDEDLPINTTYFHVAEGTNSIAYIELIVDGVGSAIICPNLRTPNTQHGQVDIAIDLGTSNSFIAYQHNGERQQFTTQHGTWNELCFMHSSTTKTGVVEKNREDLYIPFDNGESTHDECLASQLCEFIPTHISDNATDTHSFAFPIPTVINQYSVNGDNDPKMENRIPLLHSAIPFAYYDAGARDIDANNIYEGKFKWYKSLNEHGIAVNNPILENCFKSFMNELMFIIRSHMLSKGYDLNSCKLIWTYPLSFQPQLLNDYKTAWTDAYTKYFKVPQGGDIIYTNESLTPIYHCQLNPTQAFNFNILVDIGGGSTAVIGYQDGVQFTSSFEFAGNALYLSGSMNDKLHKNYFKWLVSSQCTRWQQQQSQIIGTKKISKNDPVSVIMNYGFTKEPREFEALFQNSPVQFILQFHNAAIIYQVAQLCKAKKPDQLPNEIYFTGNGSKLFALNNNEGTMIRKIFEKVYGQDISGAVLKPIHRANPKEATAVGALIGLTEGLDQNTDTKKVVMLGDSSSVFDIQNGLDGYQLNDTLDKAQMMADVKQNVIDFVTYFYQIVNVPNAQQYATLDQMLSYVNNAAARMNNFLDRQTSLSDSLFFRYITYIMQEMSLEMCPSDL